MPEQIGTLDLAVIVAYLLGIVAVGCYAGLKRRQEGEANRYFLAAHSLRWPSIGMALFATNISCLHLVSLAQAGYDSGLLMGNFEWMAAFTLVLLSRIIHHVR
jgi:SSS family solute:Na+ symporter